MDFREWMDLWLLSLTTAFAFLASVFAAVLLYLR